MGDLVKIVKRPVYDDCVREKLQSSDTYKDYLESVEVYQKDVNTTLPRVELNRSSTGLIKKDASCTFKVILSQLSKESKDVTPGVINYIDNGKIMRSYPASLKEIRVLKALAIAQISYSKEFADAMGFIFMLLFKDITTGTKEHTWKLEVDLTKMQEVVFESTTKYIDNFLAKEA